MAPNAIIEWLPPHAADPNKKWKTCKSILIKNHQKINPRIFSTSNLKSGEHFTYNGMDETFLEAIFDFMIFRDVIIHISVFFQCFRSLIVIQIA